MDPVFEIINAYKFTREGSVMTATPGDYFWAIWREYKPFLKRQGISCIKEDERYSISLPVSLYNSKLFSFPEPQVVGDLPGITKTSFLKPYQVDHTRHLIRAFETGNILDASSTGIGKTYCSIAVAMEYSMNVFVITPKSVIFQWRRAVSNTGVGCEGILNYEALKFGRSEFLSIIDDEYVWNLPANTVIIWDEAHRCKNMTTANARMLAAAVKKGIPCMALSATIAERPDHLGVIGCMLGIFTPDEYSDWLKRHGMYVQKIGKKYIMAFSGSRYHLWKIHNAIFPECGHRVNKNDLKDLFPDNMIIADACEMDNAAKINKVIKQMHKELRELSKRKEKDLNQEHPLTIRLRARQEIELLKVPTFVELATDAMDEGNSVIIFVNFVETLVSLQKHLRTDSVIRGGQKADERQKVLDDFQSNQTKIIILVIQAGSVGIDLHDTDGNYPRLSLISPTDRSVDLHQAFGRPHRSGGMSPVIQKIIFAAGTIEEKVCENVDRKLQNMEVINDGDLIME